VQGEQEGRIEPFQEGKCLPMGGGVRGDDPSVQIPFDLRLGVQGQIKDLGKGVREGRKQGTRNEAGRGHGRLSGHACRESADAEGEMDEEAGGVAVLHRRERKEAEWRVKGEGCENAWNLVKQSAGQL